MKLEAAANQLRESRGVGMADQIRAAHPAQRESRKELAEEVNAALTSPTPLPTDVFRMLDGPSHHVIRQNASRAGSRLFEHR